MHTTTMCSCASSAMCTHLRPFIWVSPGVLAWETCVTVSSTTKHTQKTAWQPPNPPSRPSPVDRGSDFSKVVVMAPS